MKTMNKTATKTLLALIDGLVPGQARKLDNAPGAFMPVSVDVLAENGPTKLVAVAHRREQNGDLVADPDVEFLVVQMNGEAFVSPTAIDHGFRYDRAATLGADLRVTEYRPRSQADLTSFCNTWMRNIKAQQEVRAA